MISTSYPSFTKRWRSSLRAISGCDIEDHAILDLDGVTFRQGALRLVALAVAIGDREAGIFSGRQRQRRERDDFRIADLILGPGLRPAVDDDGHLMAVTLVSVIAAPAGTAFARALALVAVGIFHGVVPSI